MLEFNPRSFHMPNFRLPLSGDVLQNINPWNWIL